MICVKRLISAIVVFCMLLAVLLPVVPKANAYEIYGKLKYVVSGDEVRLVGTTEASPMTITIPETIYGKPVTEIGDCAFEEYDTITQVTIGKNVRFVDDDAFKKCNNIQQVHISDLEAWCYI